MRDYGKANTAPPTSWAIIIVIYWMIKIFRCYRPPSEVLKTRMNRNFRSIFHGLQYESLSQDTQQNIDWGSTRFIKERNFQAS